MIIAGLEGSGRLFIAPNSDAQPTIWGTYDYPSTPRVEAAPNGTKVIEVYDSQLVLSGLGIEVSSRQPRLPEIEAD